MRVPRPIYVLTLFLTAGLLLAATPAEAKRAKDFNDAQIKLLFSGAEAETNTGGCTAGYDAGEGFLNFAFSPKGTFTANYQCETTQGVSETEADTGKWWVEDDQFCMKFNSTTIKSLLPPDVECFFVKYVTKKFVLYSENTAVWKLSVSHPKFSSKEKLLAALDETGARTQKVVASRSISDASKDSAAWEEIKYSNRVSDFQRYLEAFPGGMFVKLAESQMRDLITRQADPESFKSQFAGIDFGAYHALIIGIDDYENLPKLKTAVRDAKAVAAMLENNYGFKVSMLIDPERADIIDALDEYRETLGPTDNLLIYYAGHGWLDEESGEGYWLTRSAKKNRRSRWISNATITNTLKVLSAKHVMVVADSCYSGTLTRSAAIGFRDKEYYRRMASKQARVAMVSGGLEPVADDSSHGNSPFATAFLDALRKNPDVIDGTRLFSEIRRPVILNAQQTPQYSDVRNAGHEGGDFLFVRRK